jgi:hypothetical protein
MHWYSKKITARKALFTAIGFCVFSFLIIYPFRRQIKARIRFMAGIIIPGRGNGECYDCWLYFTDNVAKHESAYRNGKGIPPQANDAGLRSLFRRKRLVELESNEKYTVRWLFHSKPYILPEGARFIRELGDLYYAKCRAKKVCYVPFSISSVTRSRKSVDDLMDGNANAIRNSAHLKGKTFDVSYQDFGGNEEQTKLFISSLRDLRRQNKCFVKFERNGCLHITVN